MTNDDIWKSRLVHYRDASAQYAKAGGLSRTPAYRKPDGFPLHAPLNACTAGAFGKNAPSVAADSSRFAFPEKDHANAGVQLLPRRIAGDSRQSQMPRKGQAGPVGKGNAMGPCQ